MLFISQPVGVGFSYGEAEPGTINNFTGVYQPPSVGGIDGRKYFDISLILLRHVGSIKTK